MGSCLSSQPTSEQERAVQIVARMARSQQQPTYEEVMAKIFRNNSKSGNDCEGEAVFAEGVSDNIEVVPAPEEKCSESSENGPCPADKNGLWWQVYASSYSVENLAHMKGVYLHYLDRSPVEAVVVWIAERDATLVIGFLVPLGTPCSKVVAALLPNKQKLVKWELQQLQGSHRKVFPDKDQPLTRPVASRYLISLQ